MKFSFYFQVVGVLPTQRQGEIWPPKRQIILGKSRLRKSIACPPRTEYALAMISDESGQRLHDRATRGEPLSSNERAQLDGWLAAKDVAEGQLLSAQSGESPLAKLRSQVNGALEQVVAVARSLQRISSENDELRREVAALRQRLAAAAQPA